MAEQKESRAKAARQLRVLSIQSLRSETSPLQLGQKAKTPRTGNIGPGLTGGLVPSAAEPAPSHRLWIFPRSATSQRIESRLSRTLSPPRQDRTFLSMNYPLAG